MVMTEGPPTLTTGATDIFSARSESAALPEVVIPAGVALAINTTVTSASDLRTFTPTLPDRN